MKAYKDLSYKELQTLYDNLQNDYNNIKNQHIQLNMARGKPDHDQIQLSLDMLDTLNSQTDFSQHENYLNYGILDGIDEAKKFFGDMLDVDPEQVIVCGNSSLNIMFDQITRSYTHGVQGETPWCKLDKIKFLCPVPGYDRHFAITQHYGIEMINIPLNDYGPDMDMVEHYVNNDASVKGIWCVPQYSNPSGISYSDEVVTRFASLKPAAKDFRIYWDNAYCVHHLYDDQQDHVKNIIKECEKQGNPDLVYEFCSTSKVTIPGAGISAMATSPRNKKEILSHMTIQGIGFDKLNQFRHCLYLQDMTHLQEHMSKQAEYLRPKFKIVLDMLDKELSGLGIAKWTRPLGGYFISFDSLEGCAKTIVAKCKEAGAILTNAGATFPYGIDPKDTNIRIAPSFPDQNELTQAVKLFILCVKIVSIEKIMNAKK